MACLTEGIMLTLLRVKEGVSRERCLIKGDDVFSGFFLLGRL